MTTTETVNIPEWKILHGIADSWAAPMTDSLVAAWDAVRERISVPDLAEQLRLSAQDNIPWKLEMVGLQSAMVDVAGQIARQSALALLPRLEEHQSVKFPKPKTETFHLPGKHNQKTHGRGGGVPGDVRGYLEGRTLPAGYMYHGTPKRNLQSIREQGLLPGSGRYGGTFFGKHDEPGWSTGYSAILRVREDRITVTQRAGGWVTPHRIPPEHLEYWAKDQTWKPLVDLPERFTEAYADNWMDLQFDLRFMSAERFLEQYLPMLIVKVNAETRRAIRDAVLLGFQKGKHPYEMAEEIKALVGMTPGQVRAYQAFAANLAKNQLSASRQKEALDAYRQRAIGARARNIARTETIRAANAGQMKLWTTAEANGLLGSSVKRVWIATPTSPRTCPFCLGLDGSTSSLRGQFPGGVTQPPAHPSCRCAMGLEFE